MTVPKNGLLIGLGYSIVFPRYEEIKVPTSDNIKNIMKRLTDHFPFDVFGRNEYLIQASFFHSPTIYSYVFLIQIIYYISKDFIKNNPKTKILFFFRVSSFWVEIQN